MAHAPPSDLQQKVVGWIREEGFPLEMRVRKLIERHGESIETGYYDENADTYRAGADCILVKSNVDQFQEEGTWWQHRVYTFGIFECKSSQEKPWVVFAKPFRGHGITMVQQLTTVEEFRKVAERITHPEFRKELQPALGNDSPFIAPRLLGYHVATLPSLKGGRNPAHDAVRQVIDGALGTIREHMRYFRQPEHKNVPMFTAVNFIVTSAPIFLCYLNDQDEEVVEQVESWVLQDYRGLGRSQRSHFIRIMSEEFLKANAARVSKDLQIITDHMMRVLIKNKLLLK